MDDEKKPMSSLRFIDTHAHIDGEEFKKMAKEFNIKYGFNITKTIDLSDFKIKKGNSSFMFKLCTLF